MQTSSPLGGRHQFSPLRPKTQDPGPAPPGPPRPPEERPTLPHLHEEKAAEDLGSGRRTPNAALKIPGPPRPHWVGPRRIGYSLRGIKALPNTHRWPRGAEERESRPRLRLRPRGDPDPNPLLGPPGTHPSAPHLRRANLARTSCSSQGRREAPVPAPTPRPPGPRPARGRLHPGSPARAPRPGAPGTFPSIPAGPAPHSPRARCPSSWCRGREGARRAAGAALQSPSQAIPSPLEIPAIEESPCPRGRRLLRLAAPRLESPRRLLLPFAPQQNGPRKQQSRSPQRPPARPPHSRRARGGGGAGGAGEGREGAGLHAGGGVGLTARARARPAPGPGPTSP